MGTAAARGHASSGACLREISEWTGWSQDVQGAEEVQRQKAAAKDASLLEQRVLAVCTALGSVLADTRANVEKKQARTYEELKAEQEEQEQVPRPSHRSPRALMPGYLCSPTRQQN